MSEIHRDRRWPAVRLAAKRRDNWCCVKCGGRAHLEVAHIISAKARPDLAFDLNNVRTLDRRCHTEETRVERSGQIDPARQAWRELVRRMSIPSEKDMQCWNP
jgi:5-methylcytosine-specific restriction endonuclease McrA